MNILSKNEFCRTINELKKNDEFIDKLNDLFFEFRRDDSVYMTGLESTVVNLLEVMFKDNKTNWISYWIWECDFGESYNDGDVTDDNGETISLKTSEELYDFLLKNMTNSQRSGKN